MATVYTKPHMPVAAQIDLLLERGLEVTDRPRAEAALSRIGYYRLSEYWHTMREIGPQVRGQPTPILDSFKAGARFQDAVDLYVFDKRLRLLVLDAIERVEVAARVWCAHTLGARDSYLHRDWRELDPDFVAKDHAAWLARIDAAAARSRNDFVDNFVKEFAPPLSDLGQHRMLGLRDAVLLRGGNEHPRSDKDGGPLPG
jgi:abortive infection bacteriophage resistance protein